MSICAPLRRVSLALAVAGLVSLAGCMKSNEKTVLNKDGTGTMKVTFTMDLEKLKQLKDMLAGFGGGNGEAGGEHEDPMKEMSPEEIKKKLKGKEGVELVSATQKVSEDGKSSTTEVEFKFKTMEDFLKSGASKMQAGTKVSLEEKDGVWTLTTKLGGMAGGGEAGGGEATMPGMEEMFGAFFEGLEMVETLTVPGTIVETNGTKDEAGTSVTWKMVGKDVMKEAGKSHFVKFKGEGLGLKAFSYTAGADEEHEGKEGPEEEDEGGK